MKGDGVGAQKAPRKKLPSKSPALLGLNFKYRACFEQGVAWYSDNYRAWILPETRTWNDKNIPSQHKDVAKTS